MNENSQSRFRTGVLNALKNFEVKRSQRITEAVIEFMTNEVIGDSFDAHDVLRAIHWPREMTIPTKTEIEFVLNTLANQEFLLRCSKTNCFEDQFCFLGFEKLLSDR